MYIKFLLKTLIFGIISCALLAASFVFLVNTIQADDEIIWGVNYSESQAAYLGLDPDETYSAIIHDLGAKHIKIHVNWNATEPEQGVYNFESLDRQVKEAEDNGVNLILVIGMKTGRWPECHLPTWFMKIPEEQRQQEIVRYVDAIVDKYEGYNAVQYWQVENEPFLQFGTCPDWYYQQGTDLLKAEVAAVRAEDSSRKIIVSDSGELSTWTKVAPIADIVGITMYRSSWDSSQKTFGLNPYTFLSPEFYATKAAFIKSYYDKPVISIELQAEPWASKPLAEASLEEQMESMNPELFAENIEFAKQTGLQAYYFWGAEWWYWMKLKHDQPEIWDKAKQLFTNEPDTADSI